jgi:hypothetical protein
MKRNIIYTILALAVCGLISSCLPEKAETGLTYKGPTVVEIKNPNTGQIDTTLNRKGIYSCAAQSDSSRTVNQDAIAFKQIAVTTGACAPIAAVTVNTLSCVSAEDGSACAAKPPVYRLKANPTLAANARTTDTILVQLVGPQRSTPTVVNYTVRPATATVNPTTAVEGVNYDFRVKNARSFTIPANSSAGYILVDIKGGVMTTAGATVRLTIDLVGASDAAASVNYNKFILTIRKN